MKVSWLLLLDNSKLVQVIQDKEDYKQRNKYSHFTAKLLEVSKEASEVLLLQSLKNKGAKSIFMPTNSNGNPKGFAIVTFANQEDLEAAQSKLI